MRILLAEDEVRLSQALVELFQKNLYGVDAVYDGKEALKYAQTGIYDVIVLDLMLPSMDGLSVVRILRDEHSSTPIMILTAKDDVQDKIKGLDCGADDYMTKPFSTDELMARIRALTRRKGEVRPSVLSFGDMALDKDGCELKKIDGDSIRLSLKEFQIVEMLFENPKQIVKKEVIIEKIWGGDSDAEYNNVEVYISFLRKKMNALGVSTQIRTSRGIGYSLVAGN